MLASHIELASLLPIDRIICTSSGLLNKKERLDFTLYKYKNKTMKILTAIHQVLTIEHATNVYRDSGVMMHNPYKLKPRDLMKPMLDLENRKVNK